MTKRLTFVYAELHTLSSQTKTTPANINCSYENGMQLSAVKDIFLGFFGSCEATELELVCT